MAHGIRLEWEPLRNLAAASISGTYTAVGTPLIEHIRFACFNNSTNEELLISFDGINDHIKISAVSFIHSFKVIDISANKVRDDGLFLAKGTQIYVRSIVIPAPKVPSSGDFWVELAFAAGGK